MLSFYDQTTRRWSKAGSSVRASLGRLYSTCHVKKEINALCINCRVKGSLLFYLDLSKFQLRDMMTLCALVSKSKQLQSGKSVFKLLWLQKSSLQMVRFLICLLSSDAMLHMSPRISRYISERNVSIDIVIFSRKTCFLSPRLTCTDHGNWKKRQNCNRYSMGSWFRQVKSENSVTGYRVNINIIWNITPLKCICQNTYDQTKPLFFSHDKYFKAKISKSHIKTAFIVFLRPNEKFPTP